MAKHKVRKQSIDALEAHVAQAAIVQAAETKATMLAAEATYATTVANAAAHDATGEATAAYMLAITNGTADNIAAYDAAHAANQVLRVAAHDALEAANTAYDAHDTAVAAVVIPAANLFAQPATVAQPVKVAAPLGARSMYAAKYPRTGTVRVDTVKLAASAALHTGKGNTFVAAMCGTIATWQGMLWADVAALPIHGVLLAHGGAVTAAGGVVGAPKTFAGAQHVGVFVAYLLKRGVLA